MAQSTLLVWRHINVIISRFSIVLNHRASKLASLVCKSCFLISLCIDLAAANMIDWLAVLSVGRSVRIKRIQCSVAVINFISTHLFFFFCFILNALTAANCERSMLLWTFHLIYSIEIFDSFLCCLICLKYCNPFIIIQPNKQWTHTHMYRRIGVLSA